MAPLMSIPSERRAMLNNDNPGSTERKRLKPVVFFVIGFLLSTVFAFIAYGLTQGIIGVFELFQYDPQETCEKRIVGHYDLHAVREITEAQISKFTHLVFFPLVLHSTGTLGFKNYEQKQRFKKAMSKAKLFSVKTMFSVWDENANYEVIEEVMENAEKRLTLVNSITSLIKTHDLDGVDVYWRWSETEKESWHFLKFCKELREELTKMRAGLIFSVTFSPHTKHYSTDFRDIWKYVDFMSVDTNNYYGSWLPRHRDLVGPSSPLYSGHGNLENIDHTMKHYSCLTRKPHRFNIMVEFAGRFWNNVINDTNTLWMKAESKNGNVDGGMIFYRDLKNSGYDVRKASWNDESKTAFIWNPEKLSYLTFDNERSLAEKIKYLIGNNIGGIGVWRFDNDDETNSLLSVLSSANLCSGKNNTLVRYDCSG